MPYDFDEIIDRRHTNAINTDGFRGHIFREAPENPCPIRDEDFVRMWVADMEFATPPAICQAIQERLDRRVLGYTRSYDGAYARAFHAWCREHYDWDFPDEELCYSPGIVYALYQLVEDLVAQDEKVLTFTPAYGQFSQACRYNGVELVQSPLRRVDGHFAIDFADLEAKASDPKTRLLLLCNPHNPTGRVWSQVELEQIAALVEKHALWIISDEIHCDLLRQGLRHIPMGKIMPDYPRLITCMSASKTFNVAGLMLSDIIIRDARERRRFQRRDKLGGMLNPLSLAAHQAAYERCGPWLEELRAYLDENFRTLEQFLLEELPEAVYCPAEATYLAWVDLNRCLPDVEDLQDFFAKEAGVILQSGDSPFVGNARGFVRLNLAMPRSILLTGFTRMRDAVARHRKNERT